MELVNTPAVAAALLLHHLMVVQTVPTIQQMPQKQELAQWLIAPVSCFSSHLDYLLKLYLVATCFCLFSSACPPFDGMEQHGQYFFWETGNVAFYDANGTCSDLGLFLAPVATQDEYNALTSSTLSE